MDYTTIFYILATVVICTSEYNFFANCSCVDKFLIIVSWPLLCFFMFFAWSVMTIEDIFEFIVKKGR